LADVAGVIQRVWLAVAFGWLTAAIAKEKDFEIEAYGKSYPATQTPRTLYDPENLRLLS
jgi:4-methylaminobutanoate oxidase (formaldehyde-forming)